MGNNIDKQLDVLISLFARRDPGLRFIYHIVTRGKRDPIAYIRVYNALTGKVGVTEAAKLADVSQPTMTRVLQGWEGQGIVYDIGDDRKPLYKKLTTLPERVSQATVE